MLLWRTRKASRAKVSKERRGDGSVSEKEAGNSRVSKIYIRSDEKREEGAERDGRAGRGGGTGQGGREAWASFLERETVPCWETTTKLGEKRTGDLYK